MTVRERAVGSLGARIPWRGWVLAHPRLFGYLSLLAPPLLAGALLAWPLAGAQESVVIGGLLVARPNSISSTGGGRSWASSWPSGPPSAPAAGWTERRGAGRY